MLTAQLIDEKNSKVSGGIYHLTQVKLAYNSNRIEGNKLTEEQTRYIYETNTILPDGAEAINVDDIIETSNHFRAFDFIVEHYAEPITDAMLKGIHRILKSNTSQSRLDWFNVGDYKKLPNTIGDFVVTTQPENVEGDIRKLLEAYNSDEASLNDIIDFHYSFEKIHPFQDGNGRVGRLIMFKECLKNGIQPFIIEDDLKAFYYRGLSQYNTEPGYLRDTCLTCQDRYAEYLSIFSSKAKAPEQVVIQTKRNRGR